MSESRIELRFYCPFCEFKNQLWLGGSEPVSCLHCHQLVLKSAAVPEPFKCLLCAGDRFYLTKDFNRSLGFLIFLAGAIASIWTYGISLAVAAAIDAVLYKRLPFLKVCYLCDSEYKGIPVLAEDKAYDHVIGDLIRSEREDWQLSKKKLFSIVG